MHGQARLLLEELVKVAQQGAAARQHEAVFGDVGAEFGRRLLKGVLDGDDDLVERLGERLENLVGVDGEGAGHAFGDVAALDFDFHDFGAGEGGSACMEFI